MYSIPFFPEVMQYLFISARIQLENNSKVVNSARGGYAENVSLLIQSQIGVWVCAGHAARKTVQNCELARCSYFENGTIVVSSTQISSPIEISFPVLDQSSIGVCTVRGTLKAIFHGLAPARSHFEHHTASDSTAPHRGAIDVAGLIENQSGIGILAVSIRAPEGVQKSQIAGMIYLEHGAAPGNLAREISARVSDSIHTSVFARNHSARIGPFCTRGFPAEIVDDGFGPLSVQFEHGAETVCSTLECGDKKVTSCIAERHRVA